MPVTVVMGPTWPQDARCPKCGEKTAIVGAEAIILLTDEVSQPARAQGIHVFCRGHSCSWTLPLTRGADE